MGPSVLFGSLLFTYRSKQNNLFAQSLAGSGHTESGPAVATSFNTGDLHPIGKENNFLW